MRPGDEKPDDAKQYLISKEGENDDTIDHRPVEDEDEYGPPTITVGYNSMPIDALPSRGMFLPKGTIVEFRAANVKEIKTYSGIDEKDLVSVNAAIMSILTSCVKVKLPNGSIDSGQRLNEIDKVYMLFSVRDLTMTENNRENGLISSTTCPHCNHDNKHKVDHNTFGFYELPDKLERHYDKDTRSIVIRHESLDGGHQVINMPTVYQTNAITQYMINEVKEVKSGTKNVAYNPQTMSFLQFIIDPSAKLSKSYISTKIKEIGNWSVNNHMLMTAVSEMMSETTVPNNVVTCSPKNGGCGQQYTAPIRFRYKYLFDISGIIGELF